MQFARLRRFGNLFQLFMDHDIDKHRTLVQRMRALDKIPFVHEQKRIYMPDPHFFSFLVHIRVLSVFVACRTRRNNPKYHRYKTPRQRLRKRAERVQNRLHADLQRIRLVLGDDRLLCALLHPHLSQSDDRAKTAPATHHQKDQIISQPAEQAKPHQKGQNSERNRASGSQGAS